MMKLKRLRISPDAVQDVAAITGAALITSGAELIYRPAGFIVGGTFLLASAWLSARKADS